ncbi:uncharacterized protein LOC113214231 [Frankliniella occidentalis]|uniref:Uncharacterized protein LOC113214231 n=1 Tax=Frankliniella occidentalis TaxID=133901 RepID=A0A6J1TEP8_FRAOC|nr:uncharacterized protein LOC113214231 [Frankliniella occidentalis]
MNRNEAVLEAGSAGEPLPMSSPSALPRKLASLLPVVDQGCCCTLLTCCKIQGWVSLVGGVLNVLKVLVYAGSAEKLKDICDANEVSCLKINETISGELDEYDGGFTVITLIEIFCLILIIVAAALFLKGISDNKPSWMVWHIRIGLYHISFVLVMAVIWAVQVGGFLGFIVFLLTTITAALPLYCLICANSLHVKMCKESEVQAVTPAAYTSAPAFQYGAKGADPLNGARLNEYSYD